MRPEPPASFKPTILERIGFKRLLSPPAGYSSLDKHP